MSKPYIRLCRNCCGSIIVSTGDIGATCQHCGAEHHMEWILKICLGEKGWK